MNYLFEENQKFSQWWLWVILLSLPVMSLGLFDEVEINMYHVLISLAIPLLFYLFELRIKVNKDGLHYQFSPFHLKFYTIRMDEMESFQAIEYSPLKEYGGWGIRYGFKGKAYNVSGNLGVKVNLKDGRNILFGSQQHQEFAKALELCL